MQHLATTHMLSSALSMHLPDRENDSLIIAIPRGYNQDTHIHQCKPQVCHIQHTLDWPQHAGETLLLADSIGAYCDTEYEFLSADTKTDM